MIENDNVNGQFEGDSRREESPKGVGGEKEGGHSGCLIGSQLNVHVLVHGRGKGDEAKFSSKVESEAEANEGELGSPKGNGRHVETIALLLRLLACQGSTLLNIRNNEES